MYWANHEYRKNGAAYAVGDWTMMVLQNPPTPECAYRAFPAEIVAVDEGKSMVTLQPDVQLLWLEEFRTEDMVRQLNRQRPYKVSRVRDMANEYLPKDEVCQNAYSA